MSDDARRCDEVKRRKEIRKAIGKLQGMTFWRIRVIPEGKTKWFMKGCGLSKQYAIQNQGSRLGGLLFTNAKWYCFGNENTLISSSTVRGNSSVGTHSRKSWRNLQSSLITSVSRAKARHSILHEVLVEAMLYMMRWRSTHPKITIQWFLVSLHDLLWSSNAK